MHSDGVVSEVGVDTDLQVLQPDCEALDSLHAVLHVPHQQVECPVGEEALMGQVVLLLGAGDGNMCLPFTTARAVHIVLFQGSPHLHAYVNVARFVGAKVIHYYTDVWGVEPGNEATYMYLMGGEVQVCMQYKIMLTCPAKSQV